MGDRRDCPFVWGTDYGAGKPGKRLRGDEGAVQIFDKLKKYNLSERQKLFCFFYVQSFNARLAAIKAGYSPKSHDAPWRLMRSEPVLQAIGE
jgi:hypothetical protein